MQTRSASWPTGEMTGQVGHLTSIQLKRCFTYLWLHWWIKSPPKTRTNRGMVSVQALQSIKHKRYYSIEVESLELTGCTTGVQDNTLRVVSGHKSLAFKQSPGRLGMQIHANWLTVLLQRYVITAHIGFSCRLQCKCRSWRIFTPLCIPFIPLYSFDLFFWAAPSLI